MAQCECPSCQAVVAIEGVPAIDQRIACDECGDVHKVVAISPIKLEWAFEDLLEGPEYSVRSFPQRWRRLHL